METKSEIAGKIESQIAIDKVAKGRRRLTIWMQSNIFKKNDIKITSSISEQYQGTYAIKEQD